MTAKLEAFYENYKKKKFSYLISYTVSFIFVALFFFRYFVIYNKTFVDTGDGIVQHYNALLYYSKLLHKIWNTLLSEHRLIVPMWDFSIGFGEDILQVLNYHLIGDPLALLALICPPSAIDYLFCFLFIIRIYLGGLAFSWYSLWHGNSRFPTLIGAWIYSFSGYYILYVTKHLMFGVPLLTFPLIILGIDFVFAKKSSLLFILSTVLAALSNVYFFYIQLLLAVMYFVYRYIVVYRRFALKEFLVLAGKFIIYGSCAFLLSAMILLPVFNILFQADRVGADNAVPLLYRPSYYFKFIANFTNMQVAESSWTTLFYPAIAVVTLILIFIKKKKFFNEKLLFIILTFFAMVPFFGYMFNGFGYVINRWLFAYAMLIGFIFAKAYPELMTASEGERRTIAFVLIAISFLSLLIDETRTLQTFSSVALLLFTALLLLAFDTAKLKPLYINASCVVLYFICVGMTTFIVWGIGSEEAGNTAMSRYQDVNMSDTVLEKNNSDKAILETGDESIFRIQEIDVTSLSNSAMQRIISKPTRWFSLLVSGLSTYCDEMYYNTILSYRITGSEGRSILDALNSVKYYVAKQGSEDKLPFNYRNLAAQAETYDGIAGAYEADVSLPLGYSYESSMTKEDFMKLDIAKRQEAMIQTVVLDETGALVKDGGTAEYESESVLESMEPQGNSKIEILPDGFEVRCQQGVVKLNISGLDASENYIVMKNFNYEDISLRDCYTEEEWKGLSAFERNRIKDAVRWEIKHRGTVNVRFGKEPGNYPNQMDYYTPYQMCYTGHHNYLVNMGYSEEGISELYMFFPEPGIYKFDRFDVVCQPVEHIDGKLEKLAEEPLENIVMGENTISGTADLSKDKVMVFSIPYSEGWSAIVDGKEHELKQANIMYLAMELPAGHHDITLKYETPYLRLGAYLTLLGLVILVVLVLTDMLKYRKNKQGGCDHADK